METFSEKNPSYELKLYNSKVKLVGFSILVTLLGGFFLWAGISHADPRGIFVGVFFLMPLIAIIPRFSDTTPRLIVNPEGITSVSWEWKTIPWDEIEAVSIISTRYRTDLRIELKNKEKYYEQMSSFQKHMHQVNEWMGGGDINLGTQGLNGDVFKLLSHMAFLKSEGKLSVSLPEYYEKQYYITNRRL